MKIAPDVYLIASGALGCSYTDDADCNVYALRCGDEYVLFDSGVGEHSEWLIENLVEDGIPLDRVTALFLTHYHLDHAGGARFLRDGLGLEVAASVETAQALEAGDEEVIGLAPAKRAGVYKDHVRFEACPVDTKFNGGETLELGDDTTIEVLRTPGHSRDLVSYVVRKPGRILFFCGDTIFFGGKIVLQDVADCDVSAYSRTLRMLSGLVIDEMYPGHLIWTLHDAGRHIQAAMQYVNRMLLPPNLI